MKIAQRVTPISASATLKLTSRAKEMKSQGRPVINFGAGEPDFDTPQAVKDEGAKALASGFTKYTPTSGIPELRQAICRKFEEDQGLRYVPENVAVSCGAKHSLYNLFQVLCDHGDEVLIPSPYWVSYPEMVRLADGVPVFVETVQQEGFRLTTDRLREKITARSRILVLNSPSNPTGAILERKDLEAIADLVLRHNLIVISDEIYEYYLYGAKRHVSIASLGKELMERTVIVNGVSKSYSMTGLRIGYLAGNAEVAKKVGIVQDHSTSNPASVSQRMALAALGLPKTYREEVRSLFEKRRDLMVGLLSRAKGFRPFNPEGAFYVFCDVTGTGLASEELCEKLLGEICVAAIPGKSFGSDGHARFSFAVSEKDIEEGIGRVIQWAGKTERNGKA